MCNTRKSARCASLGMLVSFVTDSYEKQTIARHKGSKIKAWKEKAVEKKKRKTRKERERKKGEKAPFNALGSTVHVSSPTFHPALFLLASHFLIIPEVYDSARIRAEITPISILVRVQTGNRRKNRRDFSSILPYLSKKTSDERAPGIIRCIN